MKYFSLNKFSAVIASTLFATIANGTYANITVFNGIDDGASVGGSFTNSVVAENQFLAAATSFGTAQSITFENIATGFNSNFNAAPNVNVALNAPDYGSGFSGISNTTFGNLYGFNVTANGSHWLGFPTGSATFTFANPTNVFGSYFTGLQTTFGTTLTIQFSDGTSQTLNAPVQNNGGAQFFGFTDTKSFNSLTIDRPGNDAWGMDNITLASAVTTAAVPEPESYAMMLLGLGFVGAIARRKKTAA